MKNQNNESQKSPINPKIERKRDSDAKSKRIYTSNKGGEPWYLKLIFWVLVFILFGGGGVTGYILLAKYNRNKEAQTTEIIIDELIVAFQDKILSETEKLFEYKFDDAREIAFEGKEISEKIGYYIDEYFKKFNEEIEGYIRVNELKIKYEGLKKQFIELNKVDPRYRKDNMQTMPNNENNR